MTRVKSSECVWHQAAIDKSLRAERNGQKPCVIWFTGLSGAGKSTLADALERRLFARGYRTYLLDGDNVRHGLCSDLGFLARDRSENIRRVGEVAKLLVDAGLIVLVSFISPFRRERMRVRSLLAADEFVEVFVSTPLNVCEQRDAKGLYKKAKAGQIRDFTGIDSPYESPEDPDLEINTAECALEESVRRLEALLIERGIVVDKGTALTRST